MKKITITILLGMLSLHASSQDINLYNRIDRFITASTSSYANDTILPKGLVFTDTILKEDIVQYIYERYKDSARYIIRENIIDVLSKISIAEDWWVKNIVGCPPEFVGDPLWLRRLYFNTAMYFADCRIIGRYLNEFKESEYSAIEKQELIRIFRRQYPLDFATAYAQYNESNIVYRADMIARNTYKKRGVEYSYIYDSVYSALFEKYKQEFNQQPINEKLILLLGKFQLAEVIPELEVLLTDSVNAYNCALALGKMKNQKGINYLLNTTQKRIPTYDAFYVGNQDILYKCFISEIYDYTNAPCGSTLDHFSGPAAYGKIWYLQGRLEMPQFFTIYPCEEKYQDEKQLKAAQKWFEENKGKYKLKE